MEQQDTDRFSIAVIGIAGRFPDAQNVRQFWQNLLDGRESIRFFSGEELAARGVDRRRFEHPQFVKARPVVDGMERFAASFFGYSPREAALIDPQHRIFLECAWQACEDAGYAPRHMPGQVAVFAACGLSTYLLDNLVGNPSIDIDDEAFPVMLGTDKDFLATRVSYKLDLRGPGVTVQSGCSSSLTAIAMAVQNLLTWQCDMALAGGVSVQTPQRAGYLYQKDGIASPDGHCRPFSASAQGTIFGDGAGIVVLKRFEEAIRDRDHIYATIRAVVVNNDGSSKMGYTAPSVAGQADAISRCLSLAMLPADQISYVEAHGTATTLGDSAEVKALTRAFRQTTSRLGFCALGSVKSNIGHLDAAAGVAGFIKTALMLKHRWMVPTLHFEAPNPDIDFSNSPFYVNTASTAWNRSSGPLYAAVSSFGIGGTNVHAILEEPPQHPAVSCPRRVEILPLSAKSVAALDELTAGLADELRKNTPAAEIAFTLQTGREAFPLRRAIVCDHVEGALAAIEGHNPAQVLQKEAENKANLYFLYPGGGCQHPGMGRELYEQEPVFRDAVDRSVSLLQGDFGYKLRETLYPSETGVERAKAAMSNPATGLPALFVTEFATTALLLSWGLTPAAMIGHSLGEYAAACVSGVLSLADALRLVTLRGQLFASLPRGGMIAVFVSEKEIAGLRLDGVSVAAVNGLSHTVLSGPLESIDRCAAILERQQIEHRRLHIDVAAHSAMVEPIIERFREALLETHFSKPAIPFVSNLTGTYIQDEEAASPDYWCRHLRQTVRFADGMDVLNRDAGAIFLEVGPGRGLTSLIKSDRRFRTGTAISALPHALDTVGDSVVLRSAVAELWTSGVSIDWKALHRVVPRRVSLPGYPFSAESEPYWVSAAEPVHSTQKQTSAATGCFLPSWRRALAASGLIENRPQWFLLGGTGGLVDSITEHLVHAGQSHPVVKTPFPSRGGDARATMKSDSCSIESYLDLFAPFVRQNGNQSINLSILHFCFCGAGAEDPVPSFIALAQALIELGLKAEIAVITHGGAQVSAADGNNNFQGVLEAAVVAVPQDADCLRCRWIDLDSDALKEEHLPRTAAALVAECSQQAGDNAVALRGTQRWVRYFEPVTLSSPKPSPDVLPGILGTLKVKPGVYVLLGGLGELGLVLAQALASPSNTLVLASRSAGAGRARIAELEQIEAAGCSVAEYSVDVADEALLCAMIADVEQRFGPIAGVVHLAGVTGVQALKLTAELTPEEYRRQLRPKVEGGLALEQALVGRQPDFCLLFSSTASFLGGPGMLAYSVANSFLDQLALRHAGAATRWISIDWDGWALPHGNNSTGLDQQLLPRVEAVAALGAILGEGRLGQVAVAVGDLNQRHAAVTSSAWVRRLQKASRADKSLFKPYAAPKSDMEQSLAQIWADVLGLDRVGVRDNFFELGGNSLIGLRIVSKVKTGLGREMPITALFEAPTVELLARLLLEPSGAPAGSAAGRGQLRRELRGKQRHLENQEGARLCHSE